MQDIHYNKTYFLFKFEKTKRLNIQEAIDKS